MEVCKMNRVLMQYPTIFLGMLYSVSLDIKSFTLQIQNEDPALAPAPHVMIRIRLRLRILLSFKIRVRIRQVLIKRSGTGSGSDWLQNYGSVPVSGSELETLNPMADLLDPADHTDHGYMWSADHVIRVSLDRASCSVILRVDKMKASLTILI